MPQPGELTGPYLPIEEGGCDAYGHGVNAWGRCKYLNAVPPSCPSLADRTVEIASWPGTSDVEAWVVGVYQHEIPEDFPTTEPERRQAMEALMLQIEFPNGETRVEDE